MKVITASLYGSNCFAGSQFNRRSKAATWSNFLELVTILLAKFWIDWSLLIFLADVFDHTVEQYKILLKTNDAISNFKVSLIKAPLNTIYLIQFRKVGRDSVWSRVTPKSLAEVTGRSIKPRKDP